jgi:hypothetical protein
LKPTRTDTARSADPQPADASGLFLTVVHHPDPTLVGSRAAIPEAGEIVLGRGPSCALASALYHDRISRAHAALDSRNGRMTLTNLDSRNGT